LQQILLNNEFLELQMESHLLNGKVCLVTGASQGLGRHFAVVLANAGATVVVTSLKSEMDKLEDLAHEITKQGGKSIMLCLFVFLKQEFIT
jgi:NAD(P)-dependent dehydrogenase (short-subunit alcohol dehydrogenase family)